MDHFVFCCSSIETPVLAPLFCCAFLNSLFNMFWAIQPELSFMSIFKKIRQTPEKNVMEIFVVKSLAYSIQIYWSGTYDECFPWNYW